MKPDLPGPPPAGWLRLLLRVGLWTTLFPSPPSLAIIGGLPGSAPAACYSKLVSLGGEPHPQHFSYLYGYETLQNWRRQLAQTSRSFIHVPEHGKARLDGPFLAVFDDSRASQYYWVRSREQGDLFDITRRTGDAYPVVSAQRRLGLHTLGFAALRSSMDGNDLPISDMAIQLPVPEQLDHNEFTDYIGPRSVLGFIHEAFRFLYHDYDRQGRLPEDELALLRKQDRDAAHRTTHFFLYLGEVVVAHIQAQHSTHPSEPLNLETVCRFSLARQPGELVFELGRAWVAQEGDLSGDTLAAMKDFGGRDLIRTLLYQRAFSWLNHDAGARRVVMELNAKGKEHFLSSWERGFGQWQFDDEGWLAVDEPNRQEWIFSISGENLLRTEEEEMLALLRLIRAHAAEARGNTMPGYGMRANTIAVFLRQNEIPGIDRLRSKGLIPDLTQQAEFPRPEIHRYDRGIERFDPRVQYLFLRAS